MTIQHSAPQGASRQAMDSGQMLLIAAAGMLAVAAIASTAVTGVVQVGDAVAFGSLVALGELLRITLPGNRESAPIAAGGALGYALLLDIGAHPAVQSALQVVVITAGGMIVGALPHLAAGRPAKLTGMAARLVAVACVAFIFRPLAPTQLFQKQDHWWLALAVMTLLVVLAWFVDAVIGALMRAEELRARFNVALWDELRVQLPLGTAVGASALLIAFSSEVMGLYAVWVFTGPLLVSQVAFRRYVGIRTTYLETVRALSRMTEIGGYVEGGHSRRVSRLALAVGRELGMGEADLLELEYAALMHDIGQLSLSDPIPGGATVLVSADDQRRIAELGADVIRQAGVLDQVADIVRQQSEPARGADPGPPVSSRIIRAANAFDDLVGSSADRDRAAAALERLRLDTAAEYDPGVVEALSKVVGRSALSRA
ncbi:MAG TPA: HD domain-containing phosphohydrolase [Streptosporangiaceae bacterium]